MKQNQIIYGIFLTLIAILVVYFFVFDEEPGKQKQNTRSKESSALAALTGAGSDSSSSPSREASIFETDFWKSGVKPGNPGEPVDEKEQGDEDVLEPADETNPINPLTGQRYSNETMESFKELRKKFPNNSIIPVIKSPQEKADEERVRNEMNQIQTLIIDSKASPNDINRFYDYQSKLVKDRIELLEYVLKEDAETITGEFKDKYMQVLEMNKNQLTGFDEARKRALSTSKAQ